MSKLTREAFKPLLQWFSIQERDFPWRRNRTPYRVWISEIMLQQTQAQTVVPYFDSFMRTFPDIKALSAADQQAVLKHWEGLGYYSRARNIHRTAQLIVAEYDGDFPTDFTDLLKLPGIGRYTAGAILSFAFNKPYPAVDGNVLRVLSRYFNMAWQNGKPESMRQAEALIKSYYLSEDFKNSTQHPSGINEALIELGALLCTAKKTQCSNCPWSNTCMAYRAGTVAERPLPKPKTKPAISRYTVLLILDKQNHKVLLEQRSDSGLLASLWQFPMLEGFRSNGEIERYLEDCGLICHDIQELPKKTHVFSHLRWQLHAYLVRATVPFPQTSSTQLVSEADLDYQMTDLVQTWVDLKTMETLPFSAALFHYRSML